VVALRFIGDVHGAYGKYIQLANEAENSIQLGDLGLDYGFVREELDSVHHRILGGNHDNYEDDQTGRFVFQPSNFLGDFGIHSVAGYDFFFIRGGYSIDKDDREIGLDWWPREELSWAECRNALKSYEEIKPDFVISHECPASIIQNIADYKALRRGQKPGGRQYFNGKELRPSRTANLLDSMWGLHQPKMWIFGHHHVDWKETLKGTNFQCLDIMSYLDLSPKEDK
jgi:hypothetical protein